MVDKKHEKGVFYHPETGEVLNGLRQSLLSLDGRFEYPDPVPMEPSVGLQPASGMRHLVQQLIREEMSQLAEDMEMETFDEADDFDVADDPIDPKTPYEEHFDPKPAEAERVRREAEEAEALKAGYKRREKSAHEVWLEKGFEPIHPVKPVDDAPKGVEPIVKRSESE